MNHKQENTAKYTKVISQNVAKENSQVLVDLFGGTNNEIAKRILCKSRWTSSIVEDL